MLTRGWRCAAVATDATAGVERARQVLDRGESGRVAGVQRLVHGGIRHRDEVVEIGTRAASIATVDAGLATRTRRAGWITTLAGPLLTVCPALRRMPGRAAAREHRDVETARAHRRDG
ncbi:MAG: hypothetical protein R2692_02230 [Microbacterium sp.]